MATLESVIVAVSGTVSAFDLLSGEELWLNKLQGGGYGPVALEVTSRFVFASANGAKLFCLDRLTGEEAWSKSTETSGRATLIATSDEVVCVKGGEVDCFEISGKRRWHKSLTLLAGMEAAVGIPGHVIQADRSGS